MKFNRLFSFLSAPFALGIFLVLAPLACAAVTNVGPAGDPASTNAAVAGSKTNALTGTNSVAGTNAAPAELPVPLSVFDLAFKPTKDPFFPLSTRQPFPVINTNVVSAFSPVNFTLKGLSGSTSERLALINNRTLAVGESSEITTPSGKIKIHLLEIKELSVVIRAEGQPDTMEIFLRKSAQ